jgi:hypothetical protein
MELQTSKKEGFFGVRIARAIQVPKNLFFLGYFVILFVEKNILISYHSRFFTIRGYTCYFAMLLSSHFR